MEQYGNTSTYNLETVLKQNIVNADFYRNDCSNLNSWSDVVDQIFYQVDYVEPWLAGNARGPSTAFCLLHRLFVLKPTEEEIRGTINHEDSVYIRAVGFLYLRYVADPRTLWSWLGPYCGDKEEIQPSGPNGPTVTVGDFVRDLLLEQYYYETIFPRIPKKVEDEIQAGLRSRGLPTKGKGNGGCGGPDRRGADDANRRPASVKASLSVAFGQRAPNRAGTKAWKDATLAAADGSGGGRSSRDREDKASHRHGSRSRSRDRQRDRYSSHDSKDNRERERERSSRDYDSRRNDRGEHDRRGSGYDRERSDRRDYDRRDYDRRDYDRRDYDRRGERNGRDEPRRRSRSRSRSHDRSKAAGRDASDVFKERATGAGAGDVRGRYGDASGAVDLGRSSGSNKRSAEEVFRLGGRSYR